MKGKIVLGGTVVNRYSVGGMLCDDGAEAREWQTKSCSISPNEKLRLLCGGN